MFDHVVQPRRLDDVVHVDGDTSQRGRPRSPLARCGDALDMLDVEALSFIDLLGVLDAGQDLRLGALHHGSYPFARSTFVTDKVMRTPFAGWTVTL